MSWELHELQKSTLQHCLAKYLLYNSSLSHLHADSTAMQDLLKHNFLLPAAKQRSTKLKSV